ncbi:short-chain fatty acyl-CoA regulator family protein [Pseudahrensia aquimaris]|uniref:Short-chain fatty acyl-CoA regulator family protein n=1 Tax=Pseudahrensia aquimaris TaxID=744461 RepID=A0ABW3FHC5_9HYPH
MAGEKIFIGPKLRELRQARGLTQAELAKQLTVSASYINLVEHNQRSASFKFLIRLTDHFGIDWRALANTDNGMLLSDLRRISNDPVFGDAKPDVEELRSALDNAPNLVTGLLNIYNTYRSYGERLAEISDAQGAGGDNRLSIEQGVHDFFRNNNNHFSELEKAAQSCGMDEIEDRQEMYSSLRAYLSEKLNIGIAHAQNEVLGTTAAQFDSGTRQIVLSDALDHQNQVFQLAHMIAQIGFTDLLDAQLPEAMRENDGAVARLRQELANYFAAALIMPYDAFHAQAVQAKYDIDLLTTRFSVSYEMVCHRLTTLQQPGKRGIPFFFLRIDRGGNVSKRFNVTPIELARYGGACPRMDVHYCFRVPSRILTQVVEMPDHSRYLTVNRTVDRPAVRYSMEDKRLAVSLGCPVEYAQETVYGQGVDTNAPRMITPIGVNCRRCPRMDCAQRAHDPFYADLKLSAD